MMLVPVVARVVVPIAEPVTAFLGLAGHGEGASVVVGVAGIDGEEF
jgi:hypothetical protein